MILNQSVRSALFLLCIVMSVVFHEPVLSASLVECCQRGERHFASTSTCSNLPDERSMSTTCRRSASICCHRASFDAECDAGLEEAQVRSTCSFQNSLQSTVGLKQHCCDCCQLAKMMAADGQPCIAPAAFSERCLASFKKCCTTALAFTSFGAHVTAAQTRRPSAYTQNTQPAHGITRDRCDTRANRCEHKCVDRGGASVICLCNEGYSLAPDLLHCNEVLNDACTEEGSTSCDADFERCVNTGDGNYECIPLSLNDPIPCREGFHRTADGLCIDINECTTTFNIICNEHETCVNTMGGYQCICDQGFSYQRATETCEDVDECLLMIDECVTGQRCVNTQGSYKCMRTKSCGTGYVLNSVKEDCDDVNECVLGTHDCSGTYVCRNTQGSYRCEPGNCPPDTVFNLRSRACEPIDCPLGYKPNRTGKCEDLNECEESQHACRTFEQCINTPGSFKCQPRSNFCDRGYQLDTYTGLCVDINECTERSHTCLTDDHCMNTEGQYKCTCEPGYNFDPVTKTCQDIDECISFQGHVCSFNADCENTVGSFLCHCKAGYKLAADNRNCEDVDECALGTDGCEQRCMNVPGRYQCICNPGYTLSVDGRKCQDIDECQQWAGAAEALCMGACINTPGSYQCNCPRGYTVETDGRTCKDVDECAAGECSGDDKICVNTLGQFKCHTINCPPNYVRDDRFKNRCNRIPLFCNKNKTCLARPEYISNDFISLPRNVDFGDSSMLKLFTLKGPQSVATTLRFEMMLTRAKPIRAFVNAAIRNDFLLQRGDELNSVVVALRNPLDGPQDVHLEVDVKIFHVDTVVQGGYFCMQKCHKWDPVCLSNHTKSISYQFTSLPSIRAIREPIEVTRVRAESLDDNPFYVKYVMDRANADMFMVEQDRNIGVVKLKGPIRGPHTEHIHLHMNVFSKSNVLVGHNVAIIEVHVSKYFV